MKEIENKATEMFNKVNEKSNDPDNVISQEARDMFYDAVYKIMEELYKAEIMDDDFINDYLGIEGGLLGDAIEVFLHNDEEDED